MPTWRIRIVGGSLGGLFAAALLQRDGHDVKVYERSQAGLGGRGAGLVAQREISEILHAVDRVEAEHVGVVARERIYFDRSGEIIARRGPRQMQISWDHLYRTFRTLVGDEAYALGRAVRSVTQDGREVRLEFADGDEETADLVFGADGVGSVIRDAVIGHAAPSQYAGYVAWRGLIAERDLPPAAEVLLDRFAFFDAEGSHALGYVVAGENGETLPGERRYNWVWYRSAPGAAGLRAALTDAGGRPHPYSLARGQLSEARYRALLDDATAGLPPPFALAVQAEPQPFLQAIFDFETPRMANGRIALLGDAAFVVRPHTAMGVAKAAGDALALVRHLSNASDPEAALRAYELERMPPGQTIAAYGRRLGKSFE